MANNENWLKDYVDVQERRKEFKKQYPKGTLQQESIEWVRDGDGNILGIMYTAKAMRDPEDRAPGYGTAWEPFPGKSRFTRDSEVQNAETSAWGRAIAAVGINVDKPVATRQDIQNRSYLEPWSESKAKTAIMQAGGDVDKLLTIFQEAKNAGTAENVLNEIKVAGVKARELQDQQAQNQSHTPESPQEAA